MKRSILFTLLVAALLPALAGCQFLFGPESRDATRPSGIAVPGSLADPTGPLESAHLRLHAREGSGQWVLLHRITAPWDEMSVTWSGFGAAYDPAPLDSFRVDEAGWISVDLTAAVAAWASGVEPYHGLLLRYSALATPRSVFDSREDELDRPRLDLLLRGAEGLEADSLEAVADAFIWRAQPNANYGDRNPLYAGWAQNQTNVEMQALLRFDLPELPSTAAVGDRVWLDTSADGIQDPEEIGFAGITVELQDAQGQLLAVAVTDSAGRYGFADLEPGDYLLRARAPQGYALVEPGQGGDPSLDSDGDSATGTTPLFSLIAGQEDLDRDFGLRPAPLADWQPRSVRYWLRHAGQSHHGHGPDPDLVTPLLPLWLGTPGGEHSLEIVDTELAVAVLSQQLWDRCHGPNGLTALRAQTLAAKLNLAAGAEGDLAALLTTVDDFLATVEPADWPGLSREQRRQALRWWIALLRFNTSGGWWWEH